MTHSHLIRACLLLLALGLPLNAAAFNIVTSRGNPVRWPSNTPVSYQLVVNKEFKQIAVQGIEDTGSRAAQTATLDALKQAFFSWQKIDDHQLEFTYEGQTGQDETGNDGHNRLLWFGDSWQDLPFSADYVLAVTLTTFSTSSGEIKDFDIHFNGKDYSWCVLNEENADVETDGADFSNCVDVQNIATHEIGHGIGLDHSSEDPFEAKELLRTASMYYSSFPGDISRRFTNGDDSSAMVFLYGSNQNAPKVDSAYPKEADNTETSLAVEIDGANFSSSSLAMLRNDEFGIDLTGVPTEISDGKIVAVFDLSGLPEASLDLVVKNSYDTTATLPDAIQVKAVSAVTHEKVEAAGGGCGFMQAPDETQQVAQHLAILMLAIIVLCHYRWKLATVLAKR